MSGYLTREKWVTLGTEQQRRQWATETPLAWALEYQPTILLPGKGFIPYEPWPFQQDFLKCRDRFRAINKPRQCGISTTEAIDVAWEFDNVPGAQIVIISKDEPAAINFHAYVRNILLSVRDRNPDAPKILKDNEKVTTNENGSRIVSLASSKEAGRSFSATHLVLDELAFQVYADDIFQAAMATLSQTKGRVTAISTPKGRGNLFHRIFETKGHMGFTVFSYGWWDVPTYNPFYDEYVAADGAHAKKKIVDRVRGLRDGWYAEMRPTYTDLRWAQEFEGAFDANAGSVFSTRQLEKTFMRNYLRRVEDPRGLLTDWYTSDRVEGHLYATGIDLGRKNDPTVIITYDYTNLPAQVVDYKYIEADRSDWKMIQDLVFEHLLAWPGDAAHDGTGAGDAITEAVYGYSDAFIFSKIGKQNIIERVQHAMDFRQIRMPKIETLYREHQRYTWDDKDIVQDTVMANALAVNIFHSESDGFVGVDNFNFVEAAV